jgi:hypothetical protein
VLDGVHKTIGVDIGGRMECAACLLREPVRGDQREGIFKENMATWMQ